MAERDTQSLQIGLAHIGQDIEIDGILGKDSRVLRESYPIKPSRYLVIGALHAHERSCSSKVIYFALYALSGNAL
jgi:hypothetical protein